MRTYQKRIGRISLKGGSLVLGVLLTGVILGLLVFPRLPLAFQNTISDLFSGPEVAAEVQVPTSALRSAYTMDGKTVEDDAYLRNNTLLFMKSHKILNVALRQREISSLQIVKQRDDPVAWLAGALRVDYVDSSDIIRISLRSRKTDQAIQLVDAIVGAYVSAANSESHRRLMETLNQLESEHRNNRAEFRKKFNETIRLVDSVRGDAYGASQDLDNLNAALIRIQTNLEESQIALKTEQTILERFDELPVSEVDLGMLVYNDSICKSLSEEIAALSAETATNGGPDLPEDIKDRVARRIEIARRDFEQRKSELREMIQAQERAQAELRIATAEARVAALVEHEQNLSIRVDAAREKVRMSERPSADL